MIYESLKTDRKNLELIVNALENFIEAHTDSKGVYFGNTKYLMEAYILEKYLRNNIPDIDKNRQN
jgi:hypothetical protein